MKKYKSDIIFFGSLIICILLIWFLAVVVMPFLIGLALAFIINPTIKRIQKMIPNRNLAVSAFLLSLTILFFAVIILFAGQISNDFKRLNNAFRTYAENNEDILDETSQKVHGFIEKIYSPEKLKEQLNFSNDTSFMKDTPEQLFENIDIDSIKESLSAIVSFFSSKEETKEEKSSGMNWLIIFISSLVYFVYIIYTFDYFNRISDNYFKNKHSEKISRVLNDMRSTFLDYFKERTKIVLIYTAVFIISFFIIGVPGALILGVIAGFLCYIPYFQYFTLIPLSLSCLVLSTEHGPGFFLYFSITAGVFVIMSIIEELILFPKLMKGVANMNPAVMMVSVTVWGYLLGIIGVLIALPLTSLIMSYIKQVILYGKQKTKAGF